jgi:hypothetical protein
LWDTFMTSWRPLALACSLALAALSVPATAQERAVITLHQTVATGAGGTGYRFWVWVRLGNGEEPIKAMLDTGSTGLLVLASGIANADDFDLGERFQKAFGAGDVLEGRAAKAALTFGEGPEGEAAARGEFGLVTSAACVPQMPGCAASTSAFADYRIASEGRSGQGFGAILGIAPGRIEIDHPFKRLAKRWILSLPPQTEGGTGRLILNPGKSETAEFKRFELHDSARIWQGPLHAGIPGCVVPSGGKRACGIIAIDSGATSITVETADVALFDRIRKAGQYEFQFGDDDPVLWRVTAQPSAFERTSMSGGQAPLSIVVGYQALLENDLYIDSGRGVVGLKPR